MKKAAIIIIILVNIPIFVYFALRIAPRLLKNGPLSSSQASTPQVIAKGVKAVQIAEGNAIIIEGPSEYQLPGNNQLTLNYGKVYGSFSDDWIGGAIVTPTAACVILDDAEFGIVTHPNGNTEIHVNSGNLNIICVLTAAKTLLSSGQALLIAPNGTIKNIPLNMKQFKKAPTPPETPESTQEQSEDSQPPN